MFLTFFIFKEVDDIPHNHGKELEQSIKESCKKQHILWERYQDSNKFGNNEQARFTMKSPCDGHIYKDGKLYYIELKSSQTGSISYELVKTNNACRSIKAHQIKSLYERSQYEGVNAGFIMWFLPKKTKKKEREEGAFYIDIQDFLDFVTQSNKKSINFDDAKKIGTRIDIKKLRVKNLYDIEGLLNNLNNKLPF